VARSAYIYLLDDEERAVLIPFTVKHELESYLTRNFREELKDPSGYIPAFVQRYRDGAVVKSPASGEIVRSDDGKGWVVQFPRKEEA
jgi:hypothetical protein